MEGEMDVTMPEGKARPHFFRGVATIVTKLLNVVQPHVAFFGQKDAQQCVVVKQLVSANIDSHDFITSTIDRRFVI